ncbi:MaoC family dehydratase [Hominifimenecus sp. rT4P-3]|uniref:MaoC family dehydratase n=1 Tax=Hominifimenecus sp. rT4P-3 TaxID=3242979 RepID=UPI003DA385CA
MGRYWEEYQVGEKTISYGRQMTEADIRLLIACVGGSHPLHTDPAYCASRPEIGRPIMPGSMILGWMDACFHDHMCPGTDVLFFPEGYEKIRFIRPVYENDILTDEFEVTGLEERDDVFGRVMCSQTIKNQEGQVVGFAQETFLVERKNARIGGENGSKAVF